MNYSTIELNLKVPTEAIVFDGESLYARLLELEDLRDDKGKIYPLAPLLFIVILAKLVGQNQLEEIADWAKLRAKELSRLLGLKRERMPHKTTWGRVLGKAMDVAALERLVGEFFQSQLEAEIPVRGSVALAIDGKTLRGTIPKGNTRGVHLMGAYLPQKGVVLAQLAVPNTTNEITVAPKIVEQIDLRGMVVVGDAMQTQRELSVKIVAEGGDYLWLVKESQKEVLKDLNILFNEPEPVTPGFSPHPTDFRTYQKTEKGHGRLEERSIWVSSWLKDYTPFPHLEQAFKLTKKVYTLNGTFRYEQTYYGITSLPKTVANPEQLLTLLRQRWTIENGLHWRRDVLFREDWSQLRQGKAPQVNAILNNTALGLLHLAGKFNIAKARRELAYDASNAFKFLASAFLSTS